MNFQKGVVGVFNVSDIDEIPVLFQFKISEIAKQSLS
jgi:hypothetical protein